MDLQKLRDITDKLHRSELLKGVAYDVLDTFIKQQETEQLKLCEVGVTFKDKIEKEIEIAEKERKNILDNIGMLAKNTESWYDKLMFIDGKIQGLKSDYYHLT